VGILATSSKAVTSIAARHGMREFGDRRPECAVVDSINLLTMEINMQTQYEIDSTKRVYEYAVVHRNTMKAFGASDTTLARLDATIARYEQSWKDALAREQLVSQS
jgi:hypothetical protein